MQLQQGRIPASASGGAVAAQLSNHVQAAAVPAAGAGAKRAAALSKASQAPAAATAVGRSAAAAAAAAAATGRVALQAAQQRQRCPRGLGLRRPRALKESLLLPAPRCSTCWERVARTELEWTSFGAWALEAGFACPSKHRLAGEI